ncbi:uncharacterized protein LOC115888417 [Sitophilus oryzae]|uniref:Uncharacterized protein LOC115888417 n=1 Tax=Sitophilus oryzae TaxID=7048 RepID=A0A6J2YLI3_SITOR|nr:uncharacterized protein LOC115888417 [Sitophilus oryzae]
MSRLSTERRLRFSIEQDYQLLTEILRQNPFQDVSRWKDVHENFVNECNVPFSLRTCKDHCNHLLNLYTKGSLKIRPKESPEEFLNKKSLLHDLLKLRNNNFNVDDYPSPSTKYENITNDKYSLKMVLKKEIKQDILEMSDSDEDDFYWKETEEKEEEKNMDIEEVLLKKKLELEERRLALKERRLQLEEERFELDKFERTKRMELERAERDLYIKVAMKNQEIITALTNRLVNKCNGDNLCIL